MKHHYALSIAWLRKPVVLWIGVCVLLATAAAAGARVGSILRLAHQPDHPTPFLFVPPSYFALGEVWETSAFEVALPVHNTSDRDLEIDDFRTSCDCTKITPSRLVIPAHETRRIHLTLDLMPRKQVDQNAGAPAPSTSERFITITVLPKVKDLDPGRIEEWAITARVRPALRLSDSEVSFESRSRLAQPWAAKTVTATDLVGVEQLAVTSTSPDFLVTIDRPNAEGREYKIHVSAGAMLPVGSLRAQIRIVPRLANGEKLPAREIPVAGQILPDVQAIPPTLASGVQPIGAVTQETFTLLSRSGSAFEVRSVQATGEGVSVTRQGDSGTGAVYLVRQKVMKAGDQATPVNLEVRAADGTIEKLTVEATHFGLSPERK